jgi:glycosyltransferase involved in cell wall biosynthesis
VVVDDGSTDQTQEALEPHLRRIRYHLQANRGIGAARNAAVAMARGDAIAFLDADDLWPDRSLEARASVLEARPDLDGVVGAVEQFVSPDIPESSRRSYHYPPEAQVARLAGAMLLRRRTLDEVGPFDTTLAVGDTLDWIARADAAGMRIGSVRDLVLRRRIHGNNTVARNLDRQSDYLRVIKASLDRRRSLERGADSRSE